MSNKANNNNNNWKNNADRSRVDQNQQAEGKTTAGYNKTTENKVIAFLWQFDDNFHCDFQGGELYPIYPLPQYSHYSIASLVHCA